MNEMAYLKIPKGFSPVVDNLGWADSCDAIVTNDGRTLALGAALAQFLKGGFRDAQLLHFAHVLHFLAKVQHGPEFWGRLYECGVAVNRNSGALFNALTRQVPRVSTSVNLSEVQQLLNQRTELISVHWLETASPSIELDVNGFARLIGAGVGSLTDDDIRHWVRHGRGKLPDPKEQGDLPERLESFPALVERLLRMPRLAGVSELMQQVVAAISIPPRAKRQTELPVGGYSSIVNRGNPEQILFSEFAVDEDEFLRRYANNELLYWQREEPQNRQADELTIVLDQGVRTWGEPRLALTAAALTLGKQAAKRGMPCNFVFSSVDANAEPTESAFENSDLTTTPARALRKAIADNNGASDIVLMTHPLNISEAEVVSATKELKPDQRLFAVTVDERGSGSHFQLTAQGKVLLRSFGLDIRPVVLERPESTMPTQGPWAGEIDPIPMPFKLGLLDSIACIAFSPDAKDLVVFGQQGHTSVWNLGTGNCSLLPPLSLENTSFSPLCTQTTSDGINAFNKQGGFSLNFSTRRVSLLHGSDNDEINNPVQNRSATAVRSVSTQVTVAQTETDWNNLCALQSENICRVNPTTGELTWVDSSGQVQTAIPVKDGKPILKSSGAPDHLKYAGASETGSLALTRILYSSNRRDVGVFIFRTAPLQLALSTSIPFHDSNSAIAIRDQYAAIKLKSSVARVFDLSANSSVVLSTRLAKTHSEIRAELGDNWLTLHGGKFTHLLRWDRGPLEISFMQGRRTIGDFVQKRFDASVLNPHGSEASTRKMSKQFAHRWQKQAYRGNLTILTDKFGIVAVLGKDEALLAMFHVYRGTIAAWMPDGTRYGPASLTGGPTTKGALDSFGSALAEGSL
ncbi:MAG: hypothetical protein ACYTDT_11210 [Planctomycetota bacterium]|jgi:hypothetical protein